MKGHKRKYKSFISYLNRNYLCETAKFGHHKWNYYQSLCDDDFSITTNSLENVNGRLKSKVGTGFLSRLKKFEDFLVFHFPIK